MSPEQYPDELKAYLGQELPQEPKDTFQNILVYIQTKDRKFLDVSLELLGKAVELASLVGVKVETVVFGVEEKVAPELVYYGANTVYLGQPDSYDPRQYSNKLFNLIQEKKPEIVLLGQTYQAMDFAPRLAQKLKTALLTNCIQLEIEADTRLLVGTSLIYNNLLLQDIKIPEAKPQMAMSLPGKFSLPALDKNRSGETVKI